MVWRSTVRCVEGRCLRFASRHVSGRRKWTEGTHQAGSNGLKQNSESTLYIFERVLKTKKEKGVHKVSKVLPWAVCVLSV